MSIAMHRATPESLAGIVETVAGWQHPGGPVQLHPGDLGWHWRFGTRELAEVVRVWTRDGRILAAGMVEDGLIRMGIAPAVDDDAGFAAGLLAALPGGTQTVEARSGAAFGDLLRRSGWVADEPWTPLTRNLTGRVEDSGLRIEILDAHHVDEKTVEDRVTVQRASFPHSTFTRERWQTMAAAPPYRRARCLVGYRPDGEAVATVTVWSAGEGRPGLLEPMGVHHDHRGHGYGRAITVAAAAALQQMGSSTATVCTPGSNTGAVATYVSAGFDRLPDVADFRRPTLPDNDRRG
ncbi:GNAT family N-acetyltransferase [Actinoplanes flavus]|uniref:GNAT family N-acetyltransferase n=1 Tax=Actinoplanes flavus TaxID=2820290 RepID=A0ABS3V0A4_9ACTN|nr:GNAT family N-acetyltransferase [Actinoplanes flavus]MBO3744267.1 GNAT family N-acetyltransferase [Actinoplanes flavus]